jgi:hypothetical protein
MKVNRVLEKDFVMEQHAIVSGNELQCLLRTPWKGGTMLSQRLN